MLTAQGTWQIKSDSIKVLTDDDFCRYYRWHFNRAHWNTIKNQTPKYGAHIGICNPNIHKNIDCSKYLYLNDQKVSFSYDVGGNYGGFTKGFLNFWLNVFSDEFVGIADDLGILKAKEGFEYFHITILSTKGTK